MRKKNIDTRFVKYGVDGFPNRFPDWPSWDCEPEDGRYAQLGLREPINGKWTHPYSYDEFIVYFGDFKKTDSAVYDDRLWQWDYSKCEESIKAVQAKDPNGRFDSTNHVQVQEFLSLYYNKQVEVTAIVEGCNKSNGFPYKIFWFREV